MRLPVITPILVVLLLAAVVTAAVVSAPAATARPALELTQFDADGTPYRLDADDTGVGSPSTSDDRTTYYIINSAVLVPATNYAVDGATLTLVEGTTNEYVLAVTTRTTDEVGAACGAGIDYDAALVLPVGYGEPYKLTYTHDGKIYTVDERFGDGTTGPVSPPR